MLLRCNRGGDTQVKCPCRIRYTKTLSVAERIADEKPTTCLAAKHLVTSLAVFRFIVLGIIVSVIAFRCTDFLIFEIFLGQT
jgi:hypothetical protein